ncbi:MULTISPECIES: hypothetical protein [unclassified Sphingomonas]|uniref:hypothetical protein n=1 Tax=unclassified Sphingomonas TaxID=196159 RepID=UPI002862F862|nr:MULTISPECIES: hypothetical protein [unclassified Sphingomonas]MDR6114125.1 hypothetical protein [Sphingomonas sp. SORGH_AS_0789]MDR6148515.1 hypothetical protein [Sphingomonas sp. SORGH_AS_0742]
MPPFDLADVTLRLPDPSREFDLLQSRVLTGLAQHSADGLLTLPESHVRTVGAGLLHSILECACSWRAILNAARGNNMHVRLSNDRTGEVKDIKIGFSFTLFFFSSVLGIPLFLRKLNQWGGCMLLMCIVYWCVNYLPMPDDGEPWPSGSDVFFTALSFAMLGFSIFFGIKGNEMTAKHLLENGWSFMEDDRATEFAKIKWSLF